MDIQREILHIVFGTFLPEYILDNGRDKEERLSYTHIPADLFRQSARAVLPRYTNDEVNNIYHLARQEMQEDDGTYGEGSVFTLLSRFGERIFTDSGTPIEVNYPELLRWTDTAHCLGQDLFTTAYLAKRTVKRGIKTTYFAWDATLPTNNFQLKAILNKGVHENHYHLKGSAQIFPLTWISLMNCHADPQQVFRSMNIYLGDHTNYDSRVTLVPLWEAVEQAIEIRARLFERFVRKVKPEKPRGLSDRIKRNHVHGRVEMLKYMWGSRLTENGAVLDYALEKGMDTHNFIDSSGCINTNRCLAGERYLLYHCFLAAYVGTDNSSSELNDLYTYLLIKNKIRKEFIQVNQVTGFDNFAAFQDRKSNALKTKRFLKEEMIYTSLGNSIRKKWMKSVEARIIPEKNHEEICNEINFYDRVAVKSWKSLDQRAKTCEQESILPYFYVFHFVKTKTNIESDRVCCRQTCRHHRLRKDNEQRSRALAEVLQNPRMRKRIFAIDACANEFDCRPEVFANDFRYLRGMKVKNGAYRQYAEQVPLRIHATYHVGEDFVDITDGLRAIDETILFLEMEYGDRIGHALALGVDAEQYYKKKCFQFSVHNQDYLDNILWLLEKARNWGIHFSRQLENQLIEKAEQLFYDIYSEFCENVEIVPDIRKYWGSWQLRGDAPIRYVSGTFKPSRFTNMTYAAYGIPEIIGNQIRRQPEYTIYYYGYHYDDSVKRNGKKQSIQLISSEYCDLVGKVQQKMQRELAEKGIAIETNPTSNRLIGPFDRYEQHPITRFNNEFLGSSDEHKNAAQLCISINTDDLGIFDTSLENEYAVMALALEKEKRTDGSRRYTSSQVYQWLDHVREMGQRQTFRTRDEVK